MASSARESSFPPPKEAMISSNNMIGTRPKMARLRTGADSGRGDLTPNRLVLLGAVPVFLILAVVAAITVTFAVNERADQQRVTHTYQVIASLRQVLGDAQDAETGSRGYALTREQPFLEPSLAARERAARDLDRFRQLTTDNPEQQQRADRLVALVQARLDALDVSRAAAGVPAAPEVVSAMEQGKARMDALRAEIARGTAEEQVLLRTRSRAEADQKTYEVVFAVAVAVLALAVLLTAAVMLVRNNVRLADSERSRAREAAVLQATLDHIRDGIAYFAGDGSLVAFNRQFFRLLDFPDALASDKTRLADLQRLERDRPAQS